MTLNEYIDNVSKRFKLGNSTEHTFRGDLQQLIETIIPNVAATNEPKHISCGAPDYVLTKRDTPVMCVIGNPPYSVSSSNKSKWIGDLRLITKKI